jgi:pimeloyl-ACP methyl ester carboxylesterase
MKSSLFFGLLLLIPTIAQAQDTSAHTIQFVTVEPCVNLEILDWGGNGPPVVFMSGLGGTAHVFDDFAPKFTAKHHVFGITRRGFGNSGKPPVTRDNYSPDRLGDDVLAVIAKLGLVKPVLAGHSIAGQEMSSIGTRDPGKVAGLIYLDAGYEYAAFDPKTANGSTRYGVEMEMTTLEEDLRRLPRIPPDQARETIKEIQNIMPRLQKMLVWYAPQDEVADRAARSELWTYVDAVDSVKQMYGTLPVPVLAIFAEFQDCTKDCADAKIWDADRTASANAFTAVNPRARVVRLAHARHAVWKSNEADVFGEMTAFMDGLPK